MSQALRQAAYTLDDYLTREEAGDVRHEYVAGSAFAMAGGSERHNRIAVNIAMRLRSEVRGSRCGVFIADMKLRIDAHNAVYYPDVMLGCDPQDDHPLYKTAPCIVVEVLSPSTAAIDRREKRQAYLGLQSLEAYVMAEADSRRVEVLLRRADGAFESARIEEGETLTLPCGERRIGLTLDDVYEDVEGLAHAA